MQNAVQFIDKLVWQRDRMLLGTLVFRLEHYKSDDWKLGDQCFVFFKTLGIINQYRRLFALKQDFRPNNVFELGIWEGGSIAFWFECFQPQKHVALDLKKHSNSRYFDRYLEDRGLRNRVSTFWGVDQADPVKLKDILASEFDGPLDLVLDDASHLYAPTKRSFEILFPHLRPGGLYIIEDWSWSYDENCVAKDPKWRDGRPLADLVFELVQMTGTAQPVKPVTAVFVYQGIVVIERGEARLEQFALADHIPTNPAANSRQPANH